MSDEDVPQGPDQAANFADVIYWRLRREIIQGVLRPNEAIVEVDVAKRFGASRTPVRESIQRLAADGLVISRRRRWLVYEFSREEVIEIFEARIAMESYAARLASSRATDEQLDDILAWWPEWAGVDPFGRPEADYEGGKFHEKIVQAANNARLADLIERNRLFHFNYRIPSLYSESDKERALHQHRSIAEALHARNGELAERITREHIGNALDLILTRVY